MNPLLRIAYRFYRLASGSRYAIERRFTPVGLAVLVGLLASGIMGFDTDNTVAYQAFTLLLAILIVVAAFGFGFRGRFAVTRRLPRFGTAGQRFGYTLLLRNLAPKVQRGLTLLENLTDPRPGYQDWLALEVAEQKRLRSFRFSRRRRENPFRRVTIREAAVPPLPPNEEVAVEMELLPLRRGVLRFAGVTLARSDPLGLLRAFLNVQSPQSALILPKRYALPPIALPGEIKYQQGGVALASNVGQSDEFVALRDYRPGDPLRHIHWRSWARAGKPVVKEFEDEFFVRHALVLDTFVPLPHSEVFEEAVSVAASFACALQTQESLLDLLFVGPQSYCFTAGRGVAHTEQMLEVLASVQPCREQPFRALEGLVLNHAAMVSGCVCVLLAWDAERRDFVAKLRALGVPVLVLVVADSGEDHALEPGPMRDEPERFRVLEAGKIEEGLAELKS